MTICGNSILPFEKNSKKMEFFSLYLTLADEATASLDVEK